MTGASSLLARLQQAVALHKAGRTAEAKAAYEALLAVSPDNPDILHLLGVLLTGTGQAHEAMPLLQRAVGAMPRSASYQAHLAEALAAVGRAEEAEAAWRSALRLDPRNAEAGFALAGHLAARGRWIEAEPFARLAVELLPGSVPARFRLGVTLEALGRPVEALAQLAAAARAAPLEYDIHRRVVTAATAAGHPGIARRAARRSMVLRPGFIDGFAVMEAIDQLSEEAGRAGRWACRGVVVAPDAASLRGDAAWHWLGEMDYGRAVDQARRAIVSGPGLARGYIVMARAANMLADFEGAKRSVRRGLCLVPGEPELIYQYAQAEKAVGDLGRAWELDEQRVRSARFHRVSALPAPWRGPGTPADRLLVATEQGIGDELLFMSCLPDLLVDVPAPVVELDARLHPLFRRSFPGLDLIPRQAFRGDDGGVLFDYGRVVRDYGITGYIHAGSLPRLYRAERGRPATRAAYLVADPGAVADWRDRLAALGPEPKVGVCWRSIVRSAVRSPHYAPLEAWEPLLAVPGIRFVSLQYDDCRAELDALRRRTGIELWVPEGLDQTDDLDGTAALIAALDAVVSAPTAVCMCAAALGILTLRIAHSTYAIGRTHDHFFPTMHPMSPWGRPLDLPLALQRAAETLSSRLIG